MEKRFVTCLERKRSSTQASEMEGEPCRRWPEWQESQKQGKKMEMQGSGRTAGGLEGQDGAGRAWRGVGSGRNMPHAPPRAGARSFWYGRCRKNRSPESSPESSPENFAGGEWFLATIRLTGKYWEMGKVTGKKHGDRKETRSPEGFPELMTRKKQERIRIIGVPCKHDLESLGLGEGDALPNERDSFELQDTETTSGEAEVKFQVSKDTLGAMLRSMAYIREQLSNPVGGYRTNRREEVQRQQGQPSKKQRL
ncbi:Protein FAR1-related sequence 3 [Vitis vinifera]|uniref:Protein FAR1-related sequence 3 n=1 Tax=Vitis vinifera TaxID=29760 RepID=A0A438FNV0_VITVI|nr:Protein FAR1-related sequence 3 [Vitis vinifera]